MTCYILQNVAQKNDTCYIGSKINIQFNRYIIGINKAFLCEITNLILTKQISQELQRMQINNYLPYQFENNFYFYLFILQAYFCKYFSIQNDQIIKSQYNHKKTMRRKINNSPDAMDEQFPRVPEGTGDTWLTQNIDGSILNQHQTTLRRQLGQAIGFNGKWIRISSQCTQAIRLLYRTYEMNIKYVDFILLQHSGQEGFGVFSIDKINKLINMLQKQRQKFLEQGYALRCIGLLGCQVTRRMKDQLRIMRVSVYTLPHYQGSILELPSDGYNSNGFFVYSYAGRKIVDRLSNILKYMINYLFCLFVLFLYMLNQIYL